MIGAAKQLPARGVVVTPSVFDLCSSVALLRSITQPALLTLTTPLVLSAGERRCIQTHSSSEVAESSSDHPPVLGKRSEPSPTFIQTPAKSNSATASATVNPSQWSGQLTSCCLPAGLNSQKIHNMPPSAQVTSSSAGYSSSSSSSGKELPSHHVAPKSSTFGPLFDNPWLPFQDKTLKDGWQAYKEWKKLDTTSLGRLSYKSKPTLEDFKVAFPVHTPDYDTLAKPAADAVQAMWVGHASVLVQMEGVTFITDPLFSERCSFSQWFGPRRVAAPPYEIEDPKMPHLDFVVISHNHYDHLDLGSVKRLYKRYGDKLRWYVPLGVKAWFKQLGIHNVVEADWWEEVQHPGTNIRLALTPAQHWSARGILDRRRTLWGGWAVLGEKLKFWFAGDTGYCPVFKEIGERYGPFDLSAIPIGAYDPRDLLSQQHVNPAEAVQMHMDVKSQRSISIHCCTFFLTFEPMDEPPMKVREELKLQNLPENAFVTLQHGEILQTANGVDLNSPKLLGHTVYGTPPTAASWTPTQADGLLDVPGLAAAYHTKSDAHGEKK